MTIQGFRSVILQGQGEVGQVYGKLVDPKAVVSLVQKSGAGWDPWPE